MLVLIATGVHVTARSEASWGNLAGNVGGETIDELGDGTMEDEFRDAGVLLLLLLLLLKKKRKSGNIITMATTQLTSV